MDIKELALLGGDPAQHWYYRSKAAALVRCLGERRFSRVLDIGAGSGFFSRVLLDRDIVHSALCVDTGYAQDHEQIVAGKALSFRSDIERDSADLVLLMDVLEHVDDDHALLASCVSKVPQDAAFFLTVPAHQWLWSEHDEFLEHRRRYHITQVERLAGLAGLKVVSCHYYFFLVLPIAAGLRLAQRAFGQPGRRPQSQLQRHGRWSDALLGGMCRAELPFMAWNRLAGLSIFCLASRSG